MDIVPVKSSHLQIKRVKRDAARRHTTEVNFEQLRGRALSELEKDTITSLSTENLSGEGYSDDSVHSDCGDTSYYIGSQEDVYKELNEVPKNNHLDVTSRHQYQLSYELALDNMLTPFISHTPIISPLVTASITKPRTLSLNPKHVIDELVTTEQSYIRDLSDIIDGYVVPFKKKIGMLPLQQKDIEDIFGNISEIRDFHRSLLDLLFGGGHNPGKIATCFLDQAEHFKIYTQYCNNYPRSVRILKEISTDPDVSTFLRSCQLRLHHMLPLDAFLLKPVQRVLKYSLLLYEMGKRTQTESDSYEVVQSAVQKMTDVAKHIDAMKREYDMAVRVEKIQSLIQGDWTGLDLTKYGDLVLEENLRYAHYGGRNARFRTERYVFLFQKLCLITKREEDGYYYHKAHIEMADLQLTERVEKLPHCFQLRQVSTGKSHTFMTNSQQSKDLWVRSMKLLLVESIPHLPDKARELIMRGFDITPDQSPKRERHVRHHLEEPRKLHVESPPSGKGRLDAITKSQTTGWSSLSLGLDRNLKPKARSSTLPNTGPKSLISMVTSSAHDLLEEDEVSLPQSGILHVETVGDKRDIEFSEISSNADVTRHPQATVVMDATTNGIQRTNLEHRIPQLSHASSPSPQIGMANTPDKHDLRRRVKVLSKLDTCSHSENKVDQFENIHHLKEVNDMQCGSRDLQPGVLSIPNIVVDDECDDQLPDMANVVIPPPVLYLSHQSPIVDIEIESGGLQIPTDSQSKSIFTPEEESFFAELMSSNSSKIFHVQRDSNTGCFTHPVGQSHDKTIINNPPSPFSVTYTTYNHSEPDHEESDDNVTPHASPYTSPSCIRRWSVQKRNFSPVIVNEDMLSTPTASPYMNRLPLSPSSPISVHANNLSSTQVDPPTPFQHLNTEPDIIQSTSNTPMSLPKGNTLVVRRHSFSNDRIKRAVHHRQESHSTDTTPQSTPELKRSGKATNEQVAYTHFDAVNQENLCHQRKTVEVVHSNTKNVAQIEPNLKYVPAIDSPLEYEHSVNPHQGGMILPPPTEFMDEEKQLTCAHPGLKHHEVQSVDCQLLSARESSDIVPQANNHKDIVSSKQDQDTVSNDTAEESTHTSHTAAITPYESNPEELMSFDEVLASFDNYASTTGKTTKSTKHSVKLRSLSPEAKRRKQKKKQRSQTVANIDMDTMNQVKEELAHRNQGERPLPQQKSDSKVHQLAREYSRKIKDHQRSRIFKRFSTVVEESSLPEFNRTEKTEPDWLQQLKEQRKGNIKPKDVTSTETEWCHPPDEAATASNVKTKLNVKDHAEPDDEQQRKGGFKGWVRSLVDKISASGNVKDKI